MDVFCVVTGKGTKGAKIVCETPEGDIAFAVKVIAPHKYDVYSESPPGKYKTVMYASNLRDLRRRLQEWLKYELGKK